MIFWVSLHLLLTCIELRLLSSEFERLLVHCIDFLSFGALGSLEASVNWLITLGDCRLLDGLELVEPLSTSRRLWSCSGYSCERFCAHLTRVVKSNSSGNGVWRGSLISFDLNIKRCLDREAIESLNPPQRGLGVTGKSSTPQENIGLSRLSSCSLPS